jgi:hypothetical protein
VAATSLAVALIASGASHFASGRADSNVVSGYALAVTNPSRSEGFKEKAAATEDPPVDSQVRYWRAKAIKRLHLAQWFEQKRNDWRRYAKSLKFDTRSRGASAQKQRASSVRGVICSVFGAHCSEALRVAWCESRMNVYARNGDYLGLFQFGSFARAHYGFAWNALAQARSAYRYFLDAGWKPWACSP